MTNWHSQAIGAAANGLSQYSEELDLGRELPVAARLLDQARVSGDQLFFSDSLLALRQEHSTPDDFRDWLQSIVATEMGREYLAVGFAWDGLHRAEDAVGRLANLVAVLPATTPPDRGIKFLRRVALAYLHGFDMECVAFSRAVVEVLVEEFAAPEAMHDQLGRAIRRLRDDGAVSGRRLTKRQASDMFFINEQSKEVLHDEPAEHPLDALGCVERLGRLLSELHPGSRLPR